LNGAAAGKNSDYVSYTW